MTCDKCDRPKFSDEHLCDPYDRIVAELEGTPKEPHPLDEMFAAAPELWRRTGVWRSQSKDVPGTMSRIVNTDNFAGDYPDETFVLWPMRQDRAQRIADILNEDGGEHSRRYFKVEPDDYVLVPGFEP